MSIASALLAEYDFEMAATRKHLERVPADHFDWKPHPRSMALGRLAAHVAEIPGWVTSGFQADELDLSQGRDAQEDPTPASLVARFDAFVAQGRDILAGTPDAAFDEPWTLRMGAHVIFTVPRSEVYRRWVISHMVHHRAQLGVSLRLLDVNVPGTYGPSADES